MHFQPLYAAGFSGFYLPLIMVLWMLMGRAIAIELRSRVPSPIWATFWDGVFFVSSGLLAIFYGAALANVVRGVPLDSHGYFFEPLWTNFDPKSSAPGILDWYTVLIGLLALATLTTHGAAYVAAKTAGPVNERAFRWVRPAWVATIVLTAAGTVATFWLQSSMLTRFKDEPWGIVLPLLALGGLAGIGYYHARSREIEVFLSSCAYILGMLTATVFAVYPNVLPAVTKANSLTIHNAANTDFGLKVGIVWWPLGFILALVYAAVLYRSFRGKISTAGAGAH